jgi:hypothetical protein
MRYLIALLFICLISPIRADVPLEPQSGFEWDLVEDARVIGYRVYIDGALNPVSIPQGDTNVGCDELNLTSGAHEIYVTAHSAHQESDPSNTLQFTYDGSTITAPSLRLDMSVQFTVTVGGQAVTAGDDEIHVLGDPE